MEIKKVIFNIVEVILELFITMSESLFVFAVRRHQINTKNFAINVFDLGKMFLIG